MCLIVGGVDALLIETIFDTLNAKRRSSWSGRSLPVEGRTCH